tara:strand:+ start:304 stop:834 length:531 start_codon:yes stop_codon:yes gene_type:complete
MIEVIDDIVSVTYQNYVEDMISSMEWYFVDKITYDPKIFTKKDSNTGFHNIIFNKGDNTRKGQIDFLLPLLYEGVNKYNPDAVFKDLYRVRAVMWLKNQNKGSHLPHIDLDFEHHTMVYYVNDSDAPTRLYKNNRVFKEVQPKKGRALIFPGDTQHSSASPTKSSRRMILNYNFLI